MNMYLCRDFIYLISEGRMDALVLATDRIDASIVRGPHCFSGGRINPLIYKRPAIDL